MQDIGEIFHEAARSGSRGDLDELVANIQRQLEANATYGVSELSHEINRRNHMRYTPLHTAIFSRNLDAVEMFIDLGADVNLKCHGTPSLHLVILTASLPGGLQFGKSAAALILTNSCDLTAKDDQGFTALHLAAELNLSDLVSSILSAASGGSTEILLEAKDRVGQRPLHRCAEKDAACTARVLLSAGARVDSLSSAGATALHVCASHGSVGVWRALVESGGSCTEHKDLFGRTAYDCALKHGWTVDLSEPSKLIPSARANEYSASTAIITHPLCMQHFSCPPSEVDTPNVPPENVRRLTVLLDPTSGALRCELLNKGSQSEDAAKALPLVWVEEARAAAMADVLRVHEWSHVRRIQYYCEGCSEDADDPRGGMSHLDGDTAVSKLSFEAALRGAGSVCQAVDMVMNKTVKNAFCAVRPPGHHAGPRGLVQNEFGENEPDSHGFCLLNNVSIGAAYAMNMYRSDIHRIAIVDFDVHHGNGTEETVRWLRPAIDRSAFVNAFSFGSVATPRFKPWLDSDDAENVLFVSVHGFGPRERGVAFGTFYPGTGPTVIPDIAVMRPSNKNNSEAATKSEIGSGDGVTGAAPEPSAEDEEDNDSDFDPNVEMEIEESASEADSDVELQKKRFKYVLPKVKKQFDMYDATSSYADPLILDVGVGLPKEDLPAGSYRHQWRDYFRNVIFPRLMEFKPDMLMLSAGFDAHKKDTINAGYIALVEEDYDWLTRNLMHIAHSCCNGRIVSVLEGGYQINGEFSSAFARSVKTHVCALGDGLSDFADYSSDDAATESQHEERLIEEIRLKAEQKQLQLQRQREEMREAAMAAAAALERGEGGTSSLNSEPALEGSPIADGGGRKRRRAASKPVDYAQLDLEMRVEEAKSREASETV